MIGYAFTGSFCTLGKSLTAMERLIQAGEDILPIVSYSVKDTDTRFGKSRDFLEKVRNLTGKNPIATVKEAEPLGPKIALEAMIISPCTGNTLAKLSNGITDTPVTMGAKAHMRCDRPLLLAPASNDLLSVNLQNIGRLLLRKNVFFVPMIQDDPEVKPHSLVADFSLLEKALTKMREKMQIRPIFR